VAQNDLLEEFIAEREAWITTIVSCLANDESVLGLWREKPRGAWSNTLMLNLIVSDDDFHEIEASVVPRQELINHTGRMLVSSVLPLSSFDLCAITHADIEVVYPGIIAQQYIQFTWTNISIATFPSNAQVLFEKIPIKKQASMSLPIDSEPLGYLDVTDRVLREGSYFWTQLYNWILRLPDKGREADASVRRQLFLRLATIIIAACWVPSYRILS
jgi:hypothetical protein